MRILIVNDDGYSAAGINSVANSLNKRGHDICVVAPSGARSGFSHALTLHETISYIKVNNPNFNVYSVSGTPADCVKLGLFELFKSPDLLVSGINHGANVASDILYSGTVGAAMEGAYLGVKSIAVSYTDCNAKPEDFLDCAEFFAENLNSILELGIPSNSIFNINFPPNFKGLKVGKQGLTYFFDKYIENGVGDNGEKLIYIEGSRKVEDYPLNTDIYLVENGFAALTPLHFDRNDYKKLQEIMSFSIDK